MMRQEGSIEGVLQAKLQLDSGAARGDKGKGKKGNYGKSEATTEKMLLSPLTTKKIICKEKRLQQQNKAQIADQEREEQFDEKLFRELEKSVKSRVRIGNGEYLPAAGKGTVAIESYRGTKLIYEVLFVPELDQNLLSVGQLLENGFKLLFENKACLISDPSGQKMFRIKMQGKSFSLNPLVEKQIAFTSQSSVAEMWHKRLRHFHHKALLFMQRSKMISSLPNLEKHLSRCKALLGKQIRLPFKISTWRATERLQLIHTDLCGP
ncbi:uncharacterized protein LOC124888079 [Capsicum annuum]|uniref:uncharacterized protein LOC124888079 n=1 Tax=Capsicum annuum TaxID=4072 RepID=UPI001FB0C69A|nr:uncharacterized protein LOC124888079 [Capsicum annuum]